MATTSAYKYYQRQQRVLTVEDLFNKGMQHVDIPLQEGFAKSLVNFDITNSGDTLTPRGGMCRIDTAAASAFSSVLALGAGYGQEDDYFVHHTGTVLVQVGTDAVLCKYALIGVHTDTITYGACINLHKSFLIVSYADTDYCATFERTTDLLAPVGYGVDIIHNVAITDKLAREGIYTSINGNTYIPVYNPTEATKALGILSVTYHEGTNTMTWDITEVTPKDIQPTQAINYGYNMLKTAPYTFTNSVTASGALQLNGLIPKDDAGNIVFTSKVGDYVTFHLNYQYPQADVTGTKKYYAQWEIKDLASDTIITTVQQVRQSPEYTPGDSITLRVAPAFKSFTVIVKVYYKDVVDAVTYTDDATDYNTLTPIKVMTLASYYLTADSKASTQNVTPKTFDLLTATGMCAWQQRLVLWGVQGAKSTLFISEANIPEYVPYPNNAEILTNDIITAIPYMGKLLVFTTNSLYMLTMDLTGLGYTTKCIQENLVMTVNDASTIRTVRNMLYFKSGNYFYMIVPNASAGVGELQLAPISKPITLLLDSFQDTLNALIDDVYNLETALALKENSMDTCTISIADYYNYLDGDKIRNVYKCKLHVVNNPNELVTEQTIHDWYIDFILTYDTVLRAWTTYMYQTNKYRMMPYEYSVTDSTTFISIVPDATNPCDVDYVKMHNTLARDVLRIDTLNTAITFPNYQLLNTGYRALDAQHKKRFREIQFTVNNLSRSKLNFYSAFTVDDETRKDMYKYDTVHITDPADPNYGLIYVERTIAEPSTIYGETIPALTEDDTNGWVLDFSKFPTLTVAKVRIKLTGKGYNGRLKLLSKNEVKYEILTTNWVYRPMYGR